MILLLVGVAIVLLMVMGVATWLWLLRREERRDKEGR